ncbi:flagellar basal body L-ring protein FlgH [Pikeienuella piscinae]|uniref:Flagellar L-ring protein n=1 Tax=Pikeienuella piscinae TaxID=2748098 RepID=A0A7L5C3W2_9RHOB|nr:flagellar basal body L-ring protein FlgH [Pikeienuella piscinae]QIE56974.1 flagellar basal body L-ring protein FlgH [Pikeienuella piscinae]
MRQRIATQTALLALAVATGCSRLDHVGQPPPFTPSGQVFVNPTPVTPERIALATPSPAEVAAMRAPGSDLAHERSASLWRSGPSSLFGDRRAQGRGDILTVVIEIDEEAEISNATERNRSGNEDLAIAALLGLPKLVDDLTGVSLDPAAQINSSSSSAGDGSVKRNEEITLRLAATVTQVLPNGHFVIVGNQEVRVNFELRDLRVQGVIRPEDISRRNEITYDKIADARISYGGRGQITDVQQPRYGQQVADIILPF